MASSRSLPSPPPNPAPPSDPAPRAALREIWTRTKLHPVRNASILGLLTTSVVGLGVCLRYLTPLPDRRQPTAEMVSEAVSALDAGQLERARILAADLRLRTDVPESEQGIPAYVLGAVMYQDALDEWQERDRKAYFLMAARYLEESQQVGFPRGREARAAFLLGKSLHGCDRFAESLSPLRAALDGDPLKATEICHLLGDSYLRDEPPNWEQAAEFNQRFLSDPSLAREERDAALLVQARITFELGRLAECGRQLDQFQPDSAGYAEVLLLRGRLLLQAEKLSEARELFAQAQELGARNGLIVRQAQYLQGLCLRRTGDFRTAEALFARNRRSHFETPEGLASGIEEAELQHLLDNDTESVAAFRRVLRQIATTPSHVRPWIPDDELRKRLEAIITEHRQVPRFEFASDLLEAMNLVFPDARTVEQQAVLHHDWAEHLMKQAATPYTDPQARDPVTIRTQARQEFRQAGNDFGRLARLRFTTREYPADLWRSAENYLHGQDYESAARVYQEHLNSQNRTGRPPALTRLGECLLALNRPEEALRSVNESIEFFPKDPFVYRARLLAAEAQLELGREQQARELLTINLENESLTPQSREWRDSLFLLGRVHYLEGMRHQIASRRIALSSPHPTGQKASLKELEQARRAFHDCITRLSEAVQREPDAEQSVEASYMLALAHLHSARVPKTMLIGVDIEMTRVTLRRELQRELTAAIEQLDQLKSALIVKQEHGELTPVEQRILRNCYFAKADALFDMDQYEDAIQAYSSATNRYQLEPESLEAYVQIAICHRKLNRLIDSRRTLDQAKLVLGRMPAKAVYEKTTRYDRQEWKDLLGWLSNL